MTLEGELPDESIDWANCIVEVSEVTYEDVIADHNVNVDLQEAKNPESIND